MPAKAGIQGDSALASDYTSWIPGLALLARNDERVVFVIPALRQACPEPVEGGSG